MLLIHASYKICETELTEADGSRYLSHNLFLYITRDLEKQNVQSDTAHYKKLRQGP